MRLAVVALLLPLALGGCALFAKDKAVAPYVITRAEGETFVACAPTKDWTARDVFQRCGEPAAKMRFFGAEAIQCLLYATSAVTSPGVDVVVCLAPGRVGQVLEIYGVTPAPVPPMCCRNQ